MMYSENLFKVSYNSVNKKLRKAACPVTGGKYPKHGPAWLVIPGLMLHNSRHKKFTGQITRSGV